MEIIINKLDYLNGIAESINVSCKVDYHLFIRKPFVKIDNYVINMEYQDFEVNNIIIGSGNYEQCKSFLLKWKDMVY